tara:strand:+ start:2702 stop:3484 length:783 start_codon:yes stop_codon:yes gene_type:complete
MSIYLLSKIIPLIISPLGLTILFLLLSLKYRKRLLILISLGIILIFSMPITSQNLWKFLESNLERKSIKNILTKENVVSTKAIVVLGLGMHPAPGKEKISEWNDADRFFGGIEVYERLIEMNIEPIIIFPGSWSELKPNMQPEGEILKKYAIRLGVPNKRILTTGKVQNTKQEANSIAKILPNGSKIILVTSAFHIKRATRLFTQEGFRIIPFPVDFKTRGEWAGELSKDPLNFIPSSSGLKASSSALRELLGRIIYRAW